MSGVLTMSCSQGILLSSSCLERNLPDMFHLWSDTFNRWAHQTVEAGWGLWFMVVLLSVVGFAPLSSLSSFPSPRFDDEERFRSLVMMSAQELANGISYSGHMYAMGRAARSLTPAGHLQEVFGGMDQVRERPVYRKGVIKTHF